MVPRHTAVTERFFALAGNVIGGLSQQATHIAETGRRLLSIVVTKLAPLLARFAYECRRRRDLAIPGARGKCARRTQSQLDG